MKRLCAFWGILCAALSAQFSAARCGEGVEILDMVMLFDGEIGGQAADMAEMSKDGSADIHMVSFFLVPEGNPPFDKISLYEDKYRRLREAIGGGGCRTGIILQATLGHGFELEVPHPFQKMVSRDDGREGWMKNIVCPLDESFIKYLRECVRRVASLKPAVIMVDDDFRALGGRNGCLCPLHLGKIRRDSGFDLTREQLKKHLAGGSELDRKISEAAMRAVSDSLVDLAKIIRAEIDAVDPSIPCYMCGTLEDMAHDGRIARALAGEGGKSVLRIGNARYWNPKYRDLYSTARSLALQKAMSRPDRVYAEIDTFPRNRYFTSARTLHAGFVVSVLEGASGAKYWPNRFPDYEPASGREYKKILAENRGMYDELCRLFKGARPSGISDILIPDAKTLRNDSRAFSGDSAFWTHITGVMGLPVSFAEVSLLDGPCFLRGSAAKALGDAQIRKILSLGCVLDGEAAVEICRRGMGDLIGVKAAPWDKSVKISRERFSEGMGKIAGMVCEPPANPVKIEPVSDSAEVMSEFVHLPFTYGDKKFAERLAPASTYFENSLGGKVAVFASSPSGPGHLNESRKAQYVGIINRLAPGGVWYDGDAEAYLKSLKLGDGSELVVLANVGLDPIEPLSFGSARKFSRAQTLGGDGVWRDAEFSQSPGGKISVKGRAEIYMPVALRFFE